MVIQRLPGIRLERLGNNMRNQLEGGWNTGDKAKLCKMGGIVLTVKFGIGDEIAWAGRVFEGTRRSLSPLLENLGV